MTRFGSRVAVATAAVLLASGATFNGSPGGDGRIAFTSAWAENLGAEVFRVDVASGKRLNLSRNPAIDDRAVLSPDGSRILFRTSRTSDNFGGIWVMNADGSDQRRVGTGESPAWSPDRSRIVFDEYADGAERVSTMSADGGDVRRIGTGRSPAWSPDGRSIAWLDGSSLYVAAADGTGARPVLQTTAIFTGPRWSPNSTRVVVAAEILLPSGGVFSGVVVQPVAGGDPLLVARATQPNSTGLVDPQWSPDGTRIAYVDGTQVRRVAASGGPSVALTSPSSRQTDIRPAWSPDGRTVAFVRSGDYRGAQIFVVPAAGGPARQVGHNDVHTYWHTELDLLMWTPDGRSLVYSCALDGNDHDIYTVAPDDTGLRRLTDNDVEDYSPAFSPDGRWIAFVRTLRPARESFNDELFLMRADGSGVRRLTRSPNEDVAPAWSADGSRILFVRQSPSASENATLTLYTIRPDGTHLTRLHTPDRFYDSPTWSPDGRAIAATTETSSGGGIGEGGDLVRLAGGGSTPSRLLDLGDDTAWYPDWSPRGDRILFTRFTSCNYCDETGAIWTVRPDGSDARALLGEGYGLAEAAWSPDAAHVVVAGGYDTGLTIFAAGGKLERTIARSRPADAPGLSWQPLCTLQGRAGGDRLTGTGGSDRICGLGGNDTIDGRGGSDRIFGGDGSDVVDARDGTFDAIGCGAGTDTVRADRIDLVGVDCERVARR